MACGVEESNLMCLSSCLHYSVRVIKVSFTVNKGNKFRDFDHCPHDRGCSLDKDFTALFGLPMESLRFSPLKSQE